MTTIKLTSTILICTQIMVPFASSRMVTATNSIDTGNSDTTYTRSTRELKSDRIPDSVFSMTNLRHLTIIGMLCDTRETLNVNCWRLNELPAKIKNLKSLTTLTLTVGGIRTIPVEIGELNNLKLLDLTDNSRLNDIAAVTKIQSLEVLYLYRCYLTSLPDNIGDLKNLKKLGLTGNRLDVAEKTRIRKALPNCIIMY